MFGGFLYRHHAVECVDGGLFSLGVLGQHVPTLLENLNGIGGYQDGVWLGLSELAIGHLDFVLLLHGVDDGAQVSLSGRYVLQNNLVFQRTAFHEHVADGECVEHPVLYVVVRLRVVVGYVIAVLALVALYAETKYLFQGCAMAIEGLPGHRCSAT